jgi:hypothetical protein
LARVIWVCRDGLEAGGKVPPGESRVVAARISSGDEKESIVKESNFRESELCSAMQEWEGAERGEEAERAFERVEECYYELLRPRHQPGATRMTTDNASGAGMAPPKMPSDEKLYDVACDFDECKTYSDIVNFAKCVIEQRDAQWSVNATRLLAESQAHNAKLEAQVERMRLR